MVDLHVPGELAGGDAHECDTIPVGFVHVRLNLEDKGGEIRREGVDFHITGLPGQRRSGHVQEFVQEGLHTKGGQCGTEEHGALLAGTHALQIKLRTGAQKIHFLLELMPLVLADELAHFGITELNFLRSGAALKGRVGEPEDMAAGTVINTLELLAGADGPVDGAGLDAQLLLNLLAELKGIPGVPVHFIDKRKNRNMPQGADLKQLPGLGLYAFCRVDDHDGGVGGHEGTVGILGEVLVTGGVKDVDAVAVIAELEHGGRDGNTTLLLDLHPVGDGGAAVFLALDHAGLGDGASVQQKFLGEGGFTGIRVRDNGKGPAALDLFL